MFFRRLSLTLLFVAGCHSRHTDIDPGDGFPSGDMSYAQHADFPPTPVIDGNTPADAPTLFANGGGTGKTTAAPCILDPQAGSLMPQNWLRARFHYVADGGQNLFEIRLHVPSQTQDLLVYTNQTTWTMDA